MDRKIRLIITSTLIGLITYTPFFANTSSKQQKDSTFATFENELKLSEKLTSEGYYPEAYDKIWRVLIAADSLENPLLKYEAYKRLSTLYSIFRDRENALATIDSMKLYADRSGLNANKKERYTSYYTMAVAYRMNNELEKAESLLASYERYMDSIKTPLRKRMFLMTERAHIKTLKGDYNASEKILTQFEGIIPPEHQYNTIVFSMLGDLYSKKGNLQKALNYYNNSLSLIENNRISIKIELLEKIASIHQKLGNFKNALHSITSAKVLKDSLFGSQSTRNKNLFAINDSYRNSILQNKKIQKEQELELLKAKKDKLNIQLIFSFILIVSILIGAALFIQLLRKKHITEKRLAAERAEAALEIQKKELAVTALQLMEKDKLLNEIKNGLEQIEQQKDDASIKKLKSTLKVNSSKMWEEFEARFVKVNTNFYKSLQAKHPNLSRNDLKLSALIKLNFSSKEMSQLLGISADSVNKARYRLRKKLDLNRDDNLVSYIGSIN